MYEGNEFGEYMRSVRLSLGLTQKHVTELCSHIFSRCYLGQLERGLCKKPGVEFLNVLAEVYGLSKRDVWLRAGYRWPADKTSALPADLLEGLDEEDLKEVERFVTSLRFRKQMGRRS